MIACAVAVASVATGDLEVNVHLFQGFSDVIGGIRDEFQVQLGRRVATCGVVTVSSQFVVKGACTVLDGDEGQRPVKAQQRLDNESCVCGVAVIEHFVFSCAAADSTIIRRCRFRTGSSWFVVTVSMMLFFLHFASFILRREVCVRCEVCFVVLCVRLFWEQIDVLFCSMKFRCVIADAFGVGVFWMHSVATSVA